MFRRCTSVFIRGVTRWWCNACVTWRLLGWLPHPFPLSARRPRMDVPPGVWEPKNKTKPHLFCFFPDRILFDVLFFEFFFCYISYISLPLNACRYVPDLCVSLFSVVFMHFLIIVLFCFFYLFYLYYTCCRPLWQLISTFLMCFSLFMFPVTPWQRQKITDNSAGLREP